jgi:glycosyltransferase involved in cell wall biosynthesis
MVFVNGKSGDRYVRSLGFSKRTITVPYAISTKQFQDITHVAKQEELRLLYIGQIIERKGLIGFISQLDDWSKRNRHKSILFKIVGDGPLLPELHRFELLKTYALKL